MKESFYKIESKNPAKIEQPNNTAANIQTSFLSGCILARIASPTPVVEQRPAMKEAKLKIPCT